MILTGLASRLCQGKKTESQGGFSLISRVEITPPKGQGLVFSPNGEFGVCAHLERGKKSSEN